MTMCVKLEHIRRLEKFHNLVYRGLDMVVRHAGVDEYTIKWCKAAVKALEREGFILDPSLREAVSPLSSRREVMSEQGTPKHKGPGGRLICIIVGE